MLVTRPILALLVAAPALASAEPVLWAGHQVVQGARKVPLIGDVKTRTDSFFLAEVEKNADGSITLKQRTCKVEIAEAAGVEVSFLPGAAPKLPASEVVFRRKGSHWFAEFVSGWNEEDADGDGKPGATMLVDAPLCDGSLQVTNASTTRLRGKDHAGGLVGEVRAISEQKTLDADGACLSMMASDARDVVRGTFAYVPVEAGATCAALLAKPWPAKAPQQRR